MANDAERYFVEKVGLNFEQLGFPRMAGRIFGWLLISDSAQVSMNELMEALQASKSSISSITRMLINTDMIEQVAVPGDRRDYFRIRADAWTNALRDNLDKAVSFSRMAKDGLELLKEAPADRKLRLLEMHSLFTFLEREIPMLIGRWEQEYKSLLDQNP